MRKLIDARVAGLVLAVAGAMSTQACDKAADALGGDELLQQCGLTCDAKGIADGNASISGIPNVDAFFGSVVNYNVKANLIASGINSEVAKITGSLGLKANAKPADIQAAIAAKFSLDAEAGLKIAYQPAKCAVSAKATLEATAKCDATVDPGKVTAECKGSCEAEASVDAKCDAEANVVCTGTAPNLACDGTCEGTCEVTLEAAAACEGTCKGTCTGTCSAQDGQGNCAGSCDGTCEGTCEATAKADAKCEGKCKGSCTYTPPDAKCEAGASVKCEAKANASVKCEGKCEGEVEPPMASAECQASAKADASVNVECTPPSIDVQYKFAAGLSAEAQADAQANLEAWLVSFKGSLSVIVSQLAQSDVVLKAGVDIGAKAGGAVKGAIEAIDVTASLKTSVGVGCALTELPKVAAALEGSTTALTGSAKAGASLVAGFKG